MKILRAAAHKRMPWKNGGGVTTEIAIHPEGSSLDNFDWRLSMATVSADGPFSLFAGVDRTLSVLQGDGIVLSVDGLADAQLTPTTGPFAFPADKQASARLIGGAILDFNVMTRRGRFDHRVERVESEWKPFAPATTTIVFCASGSASITVGEAREVLSVHDAAIVGDVGFEVTPSTGGDIYVVTLTELA